MNTKWIVTANASRVRVYCEDGPGHPLQEIEDMVDDAVRLRTSDTMTDRLGPTSATKSVHNTGGALPNKTYEPPQTPAEHEMEVFSRRIAAFLMQAQQQGRFQHLEIAASPEFLGLLRKQIHPNVQKAVTLEVNKDYTEMAPDELREKLNGLRSGV